MDYKGEIANSGRGPLLFTAPEIQRGEKWHYSADVYSFGVLVWHVVDFWMRSCSQSALPKQLFEKICQCMSNNMEDRPTMNQIAKDFDLILDDIFDMDEDEGEIEMVEHSEAQETVYGPHFLGHKSEIVREVGSGGTFVSGSIDRW